MMPRLLCTTLPALLLLACGGGKLDEEGGDDGAGPPLDDTGGGSDGGEDHWGAAGSGQAHFVDGTTDNSLFHLEITGTQPPRDGEEYRGYLVNDAGGVKEPGAIPVTSNNATFEADIGENALIDGYTNLEVWAGPVGGGQGDGVLLWVGSVDPALTATYEELLLVDPAVPTGEGSLRAVETTTETLISLINNITSATTSIAELNAFAGEVVDSIQGGANPVDGTVPILGATGLIELILADLDTASATVEPGDPVKDYANYAYDCTTRIEGYADDAMGRADIAMVCGSEDSCDGLLLQAAENLALALNGEDANEDGTIDPIAEGTIECAITYVSQMAYMDVSVP